jgi:Leucine Rich repeat
MNTKLNDQTFHHLLDNFPWKLKKLDISKNPNLTIKSYRCLFKHFIDVKANLTHLNFEGNEIGDETCRVLCEMIMDMRTIQALNLSKCEITDLGATFLAEIIDTPGLQLRSLLLHWNKIRVKGSLALAKSVKRNNTL